MKTIRFLVINIGMLCIFYLGVFESIAWAENITLFMVWVHFIMWGIVVAGLSNVSEETFAKGYDDLFVQNKTPFSFRYLLDLIAVIFFVIAGWFVYATVSLIGLLLYKHSVTLFKERYQEINHENIQEPDNRGDESA